MEENWIAILGLLIGAAGLVVAIVASRDKLSSFPWGDSFMAIFAAGGGVLFLAGAVLLFFKGKPAEAVAAAMMGMLGVWVFYMDFWKERK